MKDQINLHCVEKIEKLRCPAEYVKEVLEQDDSDDSDYVPSEKEISLE